MKPGARVYNRWRERGRVIATFELGEPDLIAWGLLAALEPGAYVVVKWDQQPHPAIVTERDVYERPE
jgi:hypothetical protein